MCLGRYAHDVCLQGEGKGRGVERVTNLTAIFILLKKELMQILQNVSICSFRAIETVSYCSLFPIFFPPSFENKMLLYLEGSSIRVSRRIKMVELK